MSGKPSPLTASAARAPAGVSAADGGRGPSVRTGGAGISNRVLIASPRSPRRAAVEAGSGPVRPQPQLTAFTSPAQAHGRPVALAPGGCAGPWSGYQVRNGSWP